MGISGFVGRGKRALTVFKVLKNYPHKKIISSNDSFTSKEGEKKILITRVSS
jgi:hypothetical protein